MSLTPLSSRGREAARSTSLPRAILDWLDSRIGLKATVLRPVPEYSLNPLYWLGALTVIVFLVQGVTGFLILIYYMPTVEQAYSSTQYIMQSVPLGWLLETVHMYSAYAMILLAFLHMVRGYFVSAHKKPRELMWVAGMLMGLIVLALGLTGYLLPWTVVSKSATDVSVGMLGFLPVQLGEILTFLIVGPGGSAGELHRFFELHIIVLPAALLVLLGIKMYMFEVHGAAKPVSDSPVDSRDAPWFPRVVLYFAIMGCVFVAFILGASALFPLSLPPEFSPAAAASLVPQPEWYFLWMYQVLKFASFEGSGIYYALALFTLILLVLVFLPFIDRGTERNPASRRLYTVVGIVGIAELLALTVWGYFTPGEVIPDSQGLTVMLGIAVAISIMAFLTFRARRSFDRTVKPGDGFSAKTLVAQPFKNRALTGFFVLLLAIASVSLATIVNVSLDGASDATLFVGATAVFAVCMLMMGRTLRALTSRNSRGLPR